MSEREGGREGGGWAEEERERRKAAEKGGKQREEEEREVYDSFIYSYSLVSRWLGIITHSHLTIFTDTSRNCGSPVSSLYLNSPSICTHAHSPELVMKRNIGLTL